MPEPAPHTRTWTSFFLLLLLLHHCNAASTATLPASHASSTSASADVSANQRLVRSVEPVNSISEDGEEKDRCSSDFVEKFFRLLSGPVGKEGEALVAAVLKLLSENDRVNWPSMADWSLTKTSLSHDLLSANHLRRMFLEGARRIPMSQKRMSPKFNPTGWRRKRSADKMTAESVLQELLAKYESAVLLGDDDYVPKIAELSDDIKLVPEIPEWQEQKRNGLARRVLRRFPSQRMPKRKPLEFNPTGW